MTSSTQADCSIVYKYTQQSRLIIIFLLIKALIEMVTKVSCRYGKYSPFLIDPSGQQYQYSFTFLGGRRLSYEDKSCDPQYNSSIIQGDQIILSKPFPVLEIFFSATASSSHRIFLTVSYTFRPNLGPELRLGF